MGFPPPDLPPPVPTSIALSQDAAFPAIPGAVGQAASIALCLLKFKPPFRAFTFGFKIPGFPPKLPQLPRLPYGVNCFLQPAPALIPDQARTLLGGIVSPNPLNPVAGVEPGGGRPVLLQPDPDDKPGA